MGELNIIRNVSSYLNVPASNISNANGVITYGQIKGFIAVLSTLAKKSTVLNVSSNNIEYEAQVKQWLEYALLYVLQASLNKMETSILKELNIALRTKSYLVNQSLSLADIVMFYCIHPLMPFLNPSDGFVHVARWFDHLQGLGTLRCGDKEINLCAMYL